MPLPRNLSQYDDCDQLFLQALQAPKGIAFDAATPAAATHMVHRLNTFRALLRKQSIAVNLPDSPDYGKTIFDKLTVSNTKGEVEVRIRPKEEIVITNLRTL